MRLEFQKVCKIDNRKKQVYDLLDANAIFPTDKNIAILSTQERSTKTMLKLIAGIEQPTRGKIIREGTFSLPIGESNYFHRELSGEENLRFIAKMYGQNQNQLIQRVKSFAYLTTELKQKAKNYSAPLKKKITLSISLLMEFDFYQINGPIKKHAQPKFNKNIQKRLEQISKQSRLIVASNDSIFLKKYAQSAFVIDNEGLLTFCEDLDSGIRKRDQLNEDNKKNAVK